MMRQAGWHGCQGLKGVHAAAQDLHEDITVKSLERMAACTVRVLPVHGQHLAFAGGQQPDLAVEVCIKQRTGALSDAYCIGRGDNIYIYIYVCMYSFARNHLVISCIFLHLHCHPYMTEYDIYIWVTVQMQKDKLFEELMGLLPRFPAGHACLACILIVMQAGALPFERSVTFKNDE